MEQNHRQLSLSQTQNEPVGIQAELFTDVAATESFVRDLASKALEACRLVKPSAIFPHLKQANIETIKIQTRWVDAVYDYKNEKATISKNFVMIKSQQEKNFADQKANEARAVEAQRKVALQKTWQDEADRKLKIERDRADLEKREDAYRAAMTTLKEDRARLRAKFGADLGSLADLRWIEPRQLSGNPFKYATGRSDGRDPVIVMRTVFARMEAPNVARFGGFMNPMYVYGVPTERFDEPDRAVLLAFRLTKVTMPGEQPFGMGDNLIQSLILKALADARQPTFEGNYAGAYICSKFDCSDIIDVDIRPYEHNTLN